MSFPQIETELRNVKNEIREINETIKELVIQMQLMNITFEGILKPKQKSEYKPLEIKLPEKIIPGSDDDRYIKRYQEKLLKSAEEISQLKSLTLENKSEETS